MSARKPGFAKRLLIDLAGFGLLLLALLLSWVPGPGGIPLLLAGLALLATNHRWAYRLLHHLKRRGKNLADIFFPDHPVIKIIYDITAVGLFIAVILIISSVPHTVAKTALIAAGFLALTVLLMNRKRAERFSRFMIRALRP